MSEREGEREEIEGGREMKIEKEFEWRKKERIAMYKYRFVSIVIWYLQIH